MSNSAHHTITLQYLRTERKQRLYHRTLSEPKQYNHHPPTERSSFGKQNVHIYFCHLFSKQISVFF